MRDRKVTASGPDASLDIPTSATFAKSEAGGYGHFDYIVDYGNTVAETPQDVRHRQCRQPPHYRVVS